MTVAEMFARACAREDLSPWEWRFLNGIGAAVVADRLLPEQRETLEQIVARVECGAMNGASADPA